MAGWQKWRWRESGNRQPATLDVIAHRGYFAGMATVDLFGPISSGSRSPKVRSRKAELGQFFTPKPIATFMAGLFAPPSAPVRLIDAGAGSGALIEAFVERWHASVPIMADAYELDADVQAELAATLAALAALPGVATQLATGNFLQLASSMLRLQQGPRYTHAILNPPYRKIATGSLERRFCSSVGLETVNLYAGFVGLALALLEPHGQMVAIIPRSFCNGPYYLPFRRFLLERAALHRMHLFDARNKAFVGDEVLQENVILVLERDGVQRDVTISTSTDASFADLTQRNWAFSEIVAPDDAQVFIHIPGDAHGTRAEAERFGCSLTDIGVQVATGPIVDFRLRAHLRAMPSEGTVPILYPAHLSASGVNWPLAASKKPNAIARNAATERWLYPAGWYTVVRRFSSKEERRRVVATAIDPRGFPGDVIGLENHLNVFHVGRKPLPANLARGLGVYLNSSEVDGAFRRFNGHTQVNATDLRQLSYPSRAALETLGARASTAPPQDQAEVDALLDSIVFDAA